MYSTADAFSDTSSSMSSSSSLSHLPWPLISHSATFLHNYARLTLTPALLSPHVFQGARPVLGWCLQVVCGTVHLSAYHHAPLLLYIKAEPQGPFPLSVNGPKPNSPRHWSFCVLNLSGWVESFGEYLILH